MEQTFCQAHFSLKVLPKAYFNFHTPIDLDIELLALGKTHHSFQEHLEQLPKRYISGLHETVMSKRGHTQLVTYSSFSMSICWHRIMTKWMHTLQISYSLAQNVRKIG